MPCQVDLTMYLVAPVSKCGSANTDRRKENERNILLNCRFPRNLFLIQTGTGRIPATQTEDRNMKTQYTPPPWKIRHGGFITAPLNGKEIPVATVAINHGIV